MENKQILCDTVKFREFQELLFGTSQEGVQYFDSTAYIQAKGDIKKHNVQTFRASFIHWENSLREAYKINKPDMYVVNEKDGHILIDESLALLFISYIDPKFGVYMLQRAEEMFLNGFVLSDTLLTVMANSRLHINNQENSSGG